MDFVKTVAIRFSEDEREIINKAWKIFDFISRNGDNDSQHDVDAMKIRDAIEDFLENYEADD